MELRIVFILAALGGVQCMVIKSCEMKRKFVDTHNAFRLRLANGKVDKQPPASDMIMVKWNKELEDMSTRWAAKGEFSHNPNRTTASGKPAGENIFIEMTSNKNYKCDPRAAIKAWWTEHDGYNYSPVTEDGSSGHYTQLIWSKTAYIGCATVRTINNDGMIVCFTCCNYYPAGNMLGQVPYEKAKEPAETLKSGPGGSGNMYGEGC